MRCGILNEYHSISECRLRGPKKTRILRTKLKGNFFYLCVFALIFLSIRNHNQEFFLSFSWQKIAQTLIFLCRYNSTVFFIFIFAEEFQDFLSNHKELTVLLSSLLPPVENHVRESILIWRKSTNCSYCTLIADFAFFTKMFL